MSDRYCLRIIIIGLVLIVIQNCSWILKTPQKVRHFDTLQYYYLPKDETVVIEFYASGSYYTFCDVRVKKKAINGKKEFHISIFQRCAEPEEWPGIKEKIQRIKNGNFIFKYKYSEFDPSLDIFLYDGNEILFAGMRAGPFKPYKPVPIPEPIL